MKNSTKTCNGLFFEAIKPQSYMLNNALTSGSVCRDSEIYHDITQKSFAVPNYLSSVSLSSKGRRVAALNGINPGRLPFPPQFDSRSKLPIHLCSKGDKFVNGSKIEMELNKSSLDSDSIKYNKIPCNLQIRCNPTSNLLGHMLPYTNCLPRKVSHSASGCFISNLGNIFNEFDKMLDTQLPSSTYYHDGLSMDNDLLKGIEARLEAIDASDDFADGVTDVKIETSPQIQDTPDQIVEPETNPVKSSSDSTVFPSSSKSSAKKRKVCKRREKNQPDPSDLEASSPCNSTIRGVISSTTTKTNSSTNECIPHSPSYVNIPSQQLTSSSMVSEDDNFTLVVNRKHQRRQQQRLRAEAEATKAKSTLNHPLTNRRCQLTVQSTRPTNQQYCTTTVVPRRSNHPSSSSSQSPRSSIASSIKSTPTFWHKPSPLIARSSRSSIASNSSVKSSPIATNSTSESWPKPMHIRPSRIGPRWTSPPPSLDGIKKPVELTRYLFSSWQTFSATTISPNPTQ